MWPAPDPAAAAFRRNTSRPALQDWPSIAAPPFQNIGGDPARAYFAGSMTEEIVTARVTFRLNSRLVGAILLRANCRFCVPVVSKSSRLCNIREMRPEQIPNLDPGWTSDNLSSGASREGPLWVDPDCSHRDYPTAALGRMRLFEPSAPRCASGRIKAAANLGASM